MTSSIKTTSAFILFYSALELGQEYLAPNPVISLWLVLILQPPQPQKENNGERVNISQRTKKRVGSEKI